MDDVRKHFNLQMLWRGIFIMITLHHVQRADGNSSSAEVRLLDDLFRSYNKVARPVRNSSNAVLVEFQFSLGKIDELNARRQKLSTSGWFTVTWIDEFLTWDPDDYDGLDLIVVPPTMVWLPSSAVANSAGHVYEEDHYKLFRVTIESDGTISWEPGGTFLTHCEINIFYYPFDDQTCSLVIENWVYDTTKVNLTYAKSKPLNVDSHFGNEEWDILNTSVKRKDNVYPCCPEERYAELWFTLHLRRKTLYYIINIILPAFFLSTLVLLDFFLPPDSGEKIALGVTLLLSFSVFVAMIAEKVPSTSKAVPLISIYLTYLMIISSLCVCTSVTVLYLHHKGATRPLPKWVRKVFRIEVKHNSDYTAPLSLTFTNISNIVRHNIQLANASHRRQQSPKDCESYNQICEYLKEITEFVKYLAKKKKVPTATLR